MWNYKPTGRVKYIDHVDSEYSPLSNNSVFTHVFIYHILWLCNPFIVMDLDFAM
jgi:hypothetical protein